MRVILVTANQFLSQEINCSKKNSIFLVKFAPSSKNFTWAYELRGNLVPRFPMNMPPLRGVTYNTDNTYTGVGRESLVKIPAWK